MADNRNYSNSMFVILAFIGGKSVCMCLQNLVVFKLRLGILTSSVKFRLSQLHNQTLKLTKNGLQYSMHAQQEQRISSSSDFRSIPPKAENNQPNRSRGSCYDIVVSDNLEFRSTPPKTESNQSNHYTAAR